MSVHHWKVHIIFILLALYPTTGISTVNFSQCLQGIVSCANDQSGQACTPLNISNATAFSLLRTSKGTPIATTDTATALTYHDCNKYCGTGQEPFSWTGFSQEYSQWLLPYLALLSQLPFGARRKTDNLMSVILTLGSPALAGYSLFLTLLNARWVNDQLFSGVNYPSVAVRQSVVRVLSGLQQVPLRVHPGNSARFESLVVHPNNDKWWNTLATELDYSHTWSIASATSILWVVVAYLLTVADSLSDVVNFINSNGQGTGSVWLWLLPIVMGWLILSPKCDYNRVQEAYHKANQQAFVADSHDPSASPTNVTSDFGLTIDPSPDWELRDGNITSPDESRIPPVFNYSRTLSWSRTAYITSLFYRAAWRKSSHRVGVDGRPIPVNIRDDVPRESRLGNRDQIIDYCCPDHPSIDALWPRGVFFNMVVASLMSLQLQWGTTGAAVLAAWFTPTNGLGCRSLAYVIYGMLSTAVWMLLLVSSLLGYYAHHLPDDWPIHSESVTANTSALSKAGSSVPIPMVPIQSPRAGDVPPNSNEPRSTIAIKLPHPKREHARTIARVADWLRWIGKVLAIVNAIGIVANSIFQYAGVYDNCYCNSSVYSWGSSAFNIISPNQSDIALTKSAWIGALVLGLSCGAVFVGTIYLIRDSLPS